MVRWSDLFVWKDRKLWTFPRDRTQFAVAAGPTWSDVAGTNS